MSRWPFHKAYFWQEAPSFRPLPGLCAGIIAYDAGLHSGKSIPWIVAAVMLALILLIIAGFQRMKSRFQTFFFPIFFLLFFTLAGWLGYAVSDPRNYVEWFGNRLDSNAAWLVRLEEDPQARANSFRATAEVFAKYDGQKQPVNGTALLYFSKETKSLPASGDTLLIPGNWTAIRTSSNPFAFDNQTFQGRKGIYYQQFLSDDAFERTGETQPSERSLLDQVHRFCSAKLKTHLRDSATLGLIQAMILGDEQALNPELRTTYSETGVVHIVSISGAHVAVLFLLVTGLLQWIRGLKGTWVRYAVGLLLVWWYVLMAGAPPSALRSAVMFSVIALSVLSGMQGQALNTLFSSALILLVGNPAWLFSVGFQLSFLAVLSILLFYQPIYRLWPWRSWQLDRLGQALAASLAAEILTAPLVIYYFHNFPVFFLLANLLAGILAGVVVLVGGMIVIVVSGIPAVADFVAMLVNYCVHCFNAAMHLLQSWTPEMYRYLQIDSAELILFYLFIPAFAVYWLSKERRALWIALPAIFILMICLNIDAWQTQYQEKLIVYENGRNPLIERIRGNSFEIISGEKQESFNSKATHIGWHSWKQKSFFSSSLFLINDKLIFIYSDTLNFETIPALPVDILIWNRNGRWRNFEIILNAFQPQTLVLAQKSRFYERSIWEKACAERGIRLRDPARDGAFLLD